jgi:hypothetical protein
MARGALLGVAHNYTGREAGTSTGTTRPQHPEGPLGSLGFVLWQRASSCRNTFNVSPSILLDVRVSAFPNQESRDQPLGTRISHRGSYCPQDHLVILINPPIEFYNYEIICDCYRSLKNLVQK